MSEHEKSKISRKFSTVEKKDDLKGSPKKSKIIKEFMKDKNILLSDEDSKEYESLLKLLE